MNVEGFEQLLFERGVVTERGCGEIDEGFGIVDGSEKLREFVRDRAAEALFRVKQFPEILPQAIVFFGVGAWRARERFDPHAPVGMFTQDFDDLNTSKALEQEVGCAVVTFLTGTHDTDGGDAVRWLKLAGGFGEFGVETRDGEEPISGERIP